MSLILISQCAKDLDFKPSKTWPKALPAMAWNYRLLTGFERDEGLVFDISSTAASFVDAFHSCHPQLSLMELARFYVAAEKINGLFELEEDRLRFFSFYNLRYQDSLKKCFEKIVCCPEVFQQWLVEKALGPRELEILNAVSVADLKPLLVSWPQWNLSKSEGVQALEWGVELFLMGHSWENILSPKPTTGADFVQHLKSLRFPETTEKDSRRRMGLRSLPWPSQIQAQWTRSGDQAGIEIRFRVSSLSDLNKKLKGLGQVEQALSNSTSPLEWKN